MPMNGRRAPDIRLRRAYDAPDPADGRRVLVDRIWPRGVSKDQLRLDAWMKDLAPTRALRTWFGHAPSRWVEFKDRYARELDGRADTVEQLLALCRRGTVTLVFAARDTQHSNATALREYLLRRLAGSPAVRGPRDGASGAETDRKPAAR
jgi:uncharacterized protein YeaO (DUF488 family)